MRLCLYFEELLFTSKQNYFKLNLFFMGYYHTKHWEEPINNQALLTNKFMLPWSLDKFAFFWVTL